MDLLAAPPATGRSNAIDALRAIFALWVIFAHVLPWADYYSQTTAIPATLQFAGNWLAWVFQSAGETHPAVLGFIVLSGYCIHRSGLRTSADFRSYAIRRMFRIYPVYLFAIIAGMAGFSISRDIASPALEVAGTTELTAGCSLARALALAAVYPPLFRCSFLGNAPLNTVMAEIWLYIAYPALLLGVAGRFGEARLWQIVIAIWLCGVAAITQWPQLQHWWSVGSLPGFLVYWWIGAKMHDKDFVQTTRTYSLLIFGLWVATTITILTLDARIPLLSEVRKVSFALLIGLAVTHLDPSRRPFWPLSTAGRAGYSIYAFHAPAIYTLLILGTPWWVAAGLAVLVGFAMFHLVERQGVRLGFYWPKSHADPLTHRASR